MFNKKYTIIIILFLFGLCVQSEALTTTDEGQAISQGIQSQAPQKGWSRYINNNYGYSIDYPKNWSCVEAIRWFDSFNTPWNMKKSDLHKIVISEPQNIGASWQGMFELTVLPNPKGLTLEAWISSLKQENKKNKIIGGIELQISGMRAKGFKISEHDYISNNIYLAGNDIIYFFDYIAENKKDDHISQHVKTYQDIISSFMLLGKSTIEVN